MSSFERNTILSHLPETNTFNFAQRQPTCTVVKTEIYQDVSIKNAGFVFAVEICDF